MGNVTGAERKRVVDNMDPTTWHLERIEVMRTRYLAGNYEFGLHKDQLRELVQSVLSDDTCGVLDSVLWPRFAEYNSGSEANILEVLGGLAVVSRGTLEAKAEFAFRVYDFNDQGSLSHDEVCIMLLTMLSGAVLMTRRGNLPAEADIELHADHAFSRCGKDLTMRLDFVDLTTWFMSRIKELCEDRGFDLCDSPEAFLRCFELVGTHARS